MGTKILIGLGIIGFITLWLVISYMEHHVKRHGIHNIIGRALSGRRTDGQRHTNASFWRKSDGTVRGHPVGRVSKRHHRAGIANLARLLAWGLIMLLTGYGLIHGFTLTVTGASGALTVFLVYKGYRLVLRLRAWWVKRTYIAPLAEALGPVLELTGPETEELITMEPDYLTKKTGDIGRINLPPRFALTPGQRDTVEHIVTSRLPVGTELVAKTKGRNPHILLKAAPPLPSMVRFRDYINEIEALPLRTYIPGIDRTGDVYKASFAGEEPHHGYCWGTGRGKSTILKSIIAQIFHNEPDATGTIIDPKDVSLDGLLGVPGLSFYNDSDNVPGFWEGITSVYNLMTQRKDMLKADPTIEFPTHLLIMEEANSFAVMSRVIWAKIKPKGAPATPPIWADAIAPLFWRGRQFGIFIVLVAQSIQERFLGNLNLRPSLGLLSLSGYKMSQWDTYVGTSPRIKPQKGRGRALYVDGEVETWTQTLYATDTEFKDFAMANRKPLVMPTDREVIKINSMRINPGSVATDIRPGVPAPRVPS